MWNKTVLFLLFMFLSGHSLSMFCIFTVKLFAICIWKHAMWLKFGLLIV